MSEEQTTTITPQEAIETQQTEAEVQKLEPMNDPAPSINERLNHAYIAQEYTLLNGGTDNIIMIKAAREGRYPIDILLTLEGLEEVLEQLRLGASNENKKDEQ